MNIIGIPEPYLMENLRNTYKGLTMRLLVFAIEIHELTQLTREVGEWYVRLERQEYEEVVWVQVHQKRADNLHIAWKDKTLPKLKSAVNKCKDTFLRMQGLIPIIRQMFKQQV